MTLWTILLDMIFNDWNVTVLTWDVWKSVRLPVLAPKICHLKWNDMLQLQILVRYPKNWTGLILPLLFYDVGVLPSLFELFFSLVDPPTFKIQTWTHIAGWKTNKQNKTANPFLSFFLRWAIFHHDLSPSNQVILFQSHVCTSIEPILFVTPAFFCSCVTRTPVYIYIYRIYIYIYICIYIYRIYIYTHNIYIYILCN